MRFLDRVQETTTTTLTGTVTLLGAVTGFRTFASAFATGERVVYCIVGGSEWEVGEGTYTGGTLTRDLVRSSSNAGALVSFSAGTKAVFCTLPAQMAVDLGVTIAIHSLLANQ